MKLKNSLAALAALTLATAPAVAQAQSTGRIAQPVEDGNEMAGQSTILLVLALAAVIAGIVIAVDGGNDDAVSA